MSLIDDIYNPNIARNNKEQAAKNRKINAKILAEKKRAKRDVPKIKHLIESTCRKDLSSDEWIIEGKFNSSDIKQAAKELELLVSFIGEERFGIETQAHRDEEQASHDANVGRGNCD
jgi:hypothetical protein